MIGTRPIELYSEERLREFDEAEAALAAVLNRDRAEQQIAASPASTLDVSSFRRKPESRK